MLPGAACAPAAPPGREGRLAGECCASWKPWSIVDGRIVVDPDCGVFRDNGILPGSTTAVAGLATVALRSALQAIRGSPLPNAFMDACHNSRLAARIRIPAYRKETS